MLRSTHTDTTAAAFKSYYLTVNAGIWFKYIIIMYTNIIFVRERVVWACEYNEYTTDAACSRNHLWILLNILSSYCIKYSVYENCMAQCLQTRIFLCFSPVSRRRGSYCASRPRLVTKFVIIISSLCWQSGRTTRSLRARISDTGMLTYLCYLYITYYTGTVRDRIGPGRYTIICIAVTIKRSKHDVLLHFYWIYLLYIYYVYNMLFSIFLNSKRNSFTTPRGFENACAYNPNIHKRWFVCTARDTKSSSYLYAHYYCRP